MARAMTLTSKQCRAARALLDLGQRDLAQLARLGVKTIVEFEGDRREVHPNNVAAIQTALEAAGVEFDLTKGKGPGVRLKKP